MNTSAMAPRFASITVTPYKVVLKNDNDNKSTFMFEDSRTQAHTNDDYSKIPGLVSGKSPKETVSFVKNLLTVTSNVNGRISSLAKECLDNLGQFPEVRFTDDTAEVKVNVM